MSDERIRKAGTITNIIPSPLLEMSFIKSDEIVVSIGEYKALKGEGVLKAVGLGSCVGVCMYDPVSKVAGLSHVFLPYCRRDCDSNPGKYADTALGLLVREMVSLGARRERLEAKIVGGANLLEGLGDFFIDIGKQNVLAVEQVLSKFEIPIKFRDTGGKKGRSIRIDVATCEVFLSVVGEGERKV